MLMKYGNSQETLKYFLIDYDLLNKLRIHFSLFPLHSYADKRSSIVAVSKRLVKLT